MSKKIFVLPNERSGCWYYRILKPYEQHPNVTFLKSYDIDSQWFADEMKKEPIVVGRFNHANAFKILDRFFKYTLVIDMDDDLFDISPYNDGYSGLGTKEVKHGNEWLWKDGVNMDLKDNIKNMEALKGILDRADLITTSTPRLAKKWNNTFVNYNAIDFHCWRRPKKKGSKLRIGWSGGSSHYTDWFLIKEQLEELMKQDITLVLVGSKFDGTLKGVDPKKIEYWDWVDAEAHPWRSYHLNLDLAIIPLEDTRFNSYKSCIKWYEFSALGVPVIASDVAPYSDEMPKDQLFTNNLVEVVERFKDKAYRKKITDRQYRWVKENRDQKKISDKLFKKIDETS